MVETVLCGAGVRRLPVNAERLQVLLQQRLRLLHHQQRRLRLRQRLLTRQPDTARLRPLLRLPPALPLTHALAAKQQHTGIEDIWPEKVGHKIYSTLQQFCSDSKTVGEWTGWGDKIK